MKLRTAYSIPSIMNPVMIMRFRPTKSESNPPRKAKSPLIANSTNVTKLKNSLPNRFSTMGDSIQFIRQNVTQGTKYSRIRLSVRIEEYEESVFETDDVVFGLKRKKSRPTALRTVSIRISTVVLAVRESVANNRVPIPAMAHATPPIFPRFSTFTWSAKYAKHEGKPIPVENPTKKAIAKALRGMLILMKSNDTVAQTPMNVHNSRKDSRVLESLHNYGI